MQRRLLLPVFAFTAALAMLMLIQAAGNFTVRIDNSLVIVYPTPTPAPKPQPTPAPTPSPTPAPVIEIGVYQDAGCMQALTSIDWGELSPGESRNFTCYIKNQGNVPVKLYMQTGNWSSSLAQTYIELSWNREGATLLKAAIAEATFTLHVDSAIQGVTDFSFDIIITVLEA